MPKRPSRGNSRPEMERLRLRLAEAEQTLAAIRNGEVDAIAVDGPLGRQIFTLQSAEQPYRILAEHMSEGAASLGADGTILFCNERLAQMLGLRPEKVAGARIVDHVVASDRENFRKLLAPAQSEQRMELQFQGADGSHIPVLVSIKTFPAGQSHGFCLVATDLTHWKRGEAEKFAAQDAARRLALIVTSSTDGIIAKDLKGMVTSWNPGAEAIYGYSAAEMIGKSITRVVPPDRVSEFRTMMEKIAGGQQVRNYETVRTRKDGQAIHISLSVAPVRDETGKVVGVSSISRDITERRRAEESLSQASRYTRSLIEASLDPLVTISREGKITDVNAATEQATGVPREQLIGSDFSTYFTDPKKARQGYERVFAEETVRDYPLAIRHASGKTMEVLYNATVFRNDKGEVDGVFAAARDVTERKRAEEEVRQASLYTRSLIEASLDPLVTISREGKITDVNAATEKVTGVDRERLIGSDFSNYFTEPENARRGYEEVFAQGSVRDYALAIRHASGEVSDVLYNATVFRNEAGEIDGVFAAARDITKRKRAEEKLREASLYARSLIEASLDPLVTISREGKITDVNQATEKATGVTRDALVGSDFSNYFADPAKARAGYQKVFAEGYVQDYPLTLRHTSGKVMEVLYNASVYRNAQGEVTGVFAAARDITELKRAEQELRLSRERLALAQKAGHSGTFDWDIQNNINLWTPEVEEVHGLTPGEFGGRYENWEALVVPEDLPAAKLGIESALKSGEFAGEWRIRRRNDGQIRWILARAKIVFDDTGKPLRMIGVNMDVTERRQAEEEVRKLNNELEQRVVQRTAQLEAANKELEAFTYSVSHDLRAPLRHISGFSKILTEDFAPSLPEEAQHLVQRIEEGTHRMGQLVDDLLNLARVGRRDLSLQVTGLKSVVDDVIAGLKPDVGDRHVEWKVGALPYVDCDAALMKQVFQNLLSNAVKFTRPRDPAIIEIGQQERGGVAVVFVRDNGVGFSMKYADKLFGVFQRLHRVEDFEGTGVGLATVQRIIQKHGGQIWAEAELDKGATFYFSLGKSEVNECQARAVMAGEKA